MALTFLHTQLLSIQLLGEADGERWDGISEETIIGHVHLHVSSLEKTKEFYHDALGLDIIVDIPDQAVFFSSGGYHHHIGTNIWNGENAIKPASNSVGMLFYTLAISNEETRKSMVGKLKTMGYQVIEEDGKLFTEDPSGNQIHLSL